MLCLSTSLWLFVLFALICHQATLYSDNKNVPVATTKQVNSNRITQHAICSCCNYGDFADLNVKRSRPSWSLQIQLLVTHKLVLPSLKEFQQCQLGWYVKDNSTKYAMWMTVWESRSIMLSLKWKKKPCTLYLWDQSEFFFLVSPSTCHICKLRLQLQSKRTGTTCGAEHTQTFGLQTAILISFN